MFNWRRPIIFGILYSSRSKIPKNLKEIKKVSTQNLDRIKEYSDDKLKKLLLHSWKNVPYYKKILEKSKVIINGEVHLENFEKIPILTKEIIRKEGKNLYSKDSIKRKSYENTSGGSTGEPVRFIQDKEYDDWNNATKIYFKTFVNQKIGDKELRLWGSERDLLEGKEKNSIRLRNWLYNRKEINSFKMSEKVMSEYVEFWNDFKPRWVEAYAQAMYEFAIFIKNNNLQIYKPNGILTSAGTLYPYMRKEIEEVFDCPVFNRYGSREVGGVACSCEKNNQLHIAFWNNFVEILDKNNKSISNEEFGKIHITTLNNYSMPLIRYDIGDIGVKSNDNSCKCKRNLPLIKSIEGREMNIFKTREGKIIPAEFFIHFIGVVYNKGFISKFQVIQENYDEIRIKLIIKDKKGFEKSKNEIESSIKKVMGSKCNIIWEPVKDIPALKSGKYLYTINKINNNQIKK